MSYNYNYTYDYDNVSTGATGGILALLGAYSIIMWLIAILGIVCMWKIFTKAGKEGWKAIIPIYNMIVLLEIVELPLWYFVLFFIPIAQIYALFKIYIELAHKFGKSTGFGIAMIFFSVICLPILAFSKSAVYQGGSVQSVAAPVYNNPDPNMGYNNQQVNNMNGFAANPTPTDANQTVNPEPMDAAQPTNTQFFNQEPQVQNNMPPVSDQPAQQPIEQTKFCTNCGAKVDINATVCPACNQTFM